MDASSLPDRQDGAAIGAFTEIHKRIARAAEIQGNRARAERARIAAWGKFGRGPRVRVKTDTGGTLWIPDPVRPDRVRLDAARRERLNPAPLDCVRRHIVTDGGFTDFQKSDPTMRQWPEDQPLKAKRRPHPNLPRPLWPTPLTPPPLNGASHAFAAHRIRPEDTAWPGRWIAEHPDAAAGIVREAIRISADAEANALPLSERQAAEYRQSCNRLRRALEIYRSGPGPLAYSTVWNGPDF